MTLYSFGFGDGKSKTKKQLQEELDEIYLETVAYSLVLLDLGYTQEVIEEKVKEKICKMKNIMQKK